jgi:ABC-type maltose transport system permease subunit
MFNILYILTSSNDRLNILLNTHQYFVKNTKFNNYHGLLQHLKRIYPTFLKKINNSKILL